jgi:MoaA/NifB/PqqE/SkfB family radical SAM enzyme
MLSSSIYRSAYCQNCGTLQWAELPYEEQLVSAPCENCGKLVYFSRYERIDIGLSEVCNLKCNMCRRPQDKEEISLDRAKELLTEGRAIGVNTLSFSGGEPFVHKDFREILEFALDAGYQVELVTNGTLVRPNDFPLLARLKCVTVSIDGTEAIHDQIRGKKGAFRASMRTIANLATAGAKWGTNTVIQRANSGQLWEIWLSIRSAGCPSYIGFTHVEVVPETQHLMPTGEMMESAIDAITRVREACAREHIHFNEPEMHGALALAFFDKSKRYRPTQGCQIPQKFLGITTHGIYPCWHQGVSLRHASLLEALASDACGRIVEKGLKRTCIGCNSANYSWDQEWMAGMVSAATDGDYEAGVVFLSEEARIAQTSGGHAVSIPIVERNKRGPKR